MKTSFTELLGIKHPIMLAGMNWLTTPKLVAAVSNAGGLGNLAVTAHTPEKLRKDIKEIRELTDKPFAINQILMSPTAMKNLSIVIEERVPIINYTLGRPSDITPLVKAVHAYGGKVIATVALARHALRAEQLGADVVNITGHEAAAHAAQATSLILIPLVAGMVKIPITAAGGFHDGRSLAAAIALGASAVTMGSRFAMTKECLLHKRWQEAILNATEQDTVYLDLGDPAANSRVLRTKRAEAEMKNRFPIMNAITGAVEAKNILKLSWLDMIRSGLDTGKGEGGMTLRQQMLYAATTAQSERVILQGDIDAGVFPIGQVIGGINDIPTVAELVVRTMNEARQALRSAWDKAQAE
jgi:enoyl-[acyl-carrier protein] reductase II